MVISRKKNKHDPRYEPTIRDADGDVEDNGAGYDTLDGNAYEARYNKDNGNNDERTYGKGV